ncbi:MAG: acetyltransferase, family protein [Pseudarthrobacter sp.]|nr:acetyltransferase, family protein [Pseudarthrobacter sp.]
MDVQIRRVSQDDHAELADLVKPWNSTKSADLRYGKTLGPEYTNFVATTDGRIVGWLQGVHNSKLWEQFHRHEEPPVGPRCSYVYFLYVDPSVRKRGFGAELLGEFETDALDSGNHFVCLDPNSREYDPPSFRFYLKQHYSFAGESAGSYSHLMGKHLDYA